MRRLALVLVMGGIVGACLPDPAATTSPPVATPPPPTTTTLAPAEALTRFASCLEERGVVVPDLELDETGRPDLAALALANDPASPGFRAALNDCAFLLVGSGALVIGDVPELLAAVRGQLVLFTDCMREAGVEEFPDPDPDFDGTGPPYSVAAIPTDDPDLVEAIETCGSRLGMSPLTG
ncbi:MAG TPA: hypothetical protein VJR05_01595 [Acidimicrobiia bacterium]|nr:hypothetical protein [Acidimicrobiia bacterium]